MAATHPKKFIAERLMALSRAFARFRPGFQPRAGGKRERGEGAFSHPQVTLRLGFSQRGTRNVGTFREVLNLKAWDLETS
jgi:hypothetical protein